MHYTPPAPSTQKDTGAKTPASQVSKTGPRLYKKKVPGPNPQPTDPLFIPQPSIAFCPLPLNPQNPTSSSSLLQKTPTLNPPSASSDMTIDLSYNPFTPLKDLSPDHIKKPYLKRS